MKRAGFLNTRVQWNSQKTLRDGFYRCLSDTVATGQLEVRTAIDYLTNEGMYSTLKTL